MVEPAAVRLVRAGRTDRVRRVREGGGGPPRGADERVAAAFRLPLAACMRGVGLGHLCAAAALPLLGALRISRRSLLPIPKLAFSFFPHQHPIPILSSLAPCFSTPALFPSDQPMPLPAPERLSLHLAEYVPRVHLLTLTPVFHPDVGGCQSAELTVQKGLPRLGWPECHVCLPFQIMDGSFVQHSVRVLQELNKQREKGEYCDATLDVGGLVFKAHRSVLACCSHFFQRIYGDGSGGNVVLPAGFAEIFGLLLDFFYTGHLALTSGNRDQVLLAAKELRVPEAVELCQSFQPKTSAGEAHSGPGHPASQDVKNHLKEPTDLDEEEVFRTLSLAPVDQETRDSQQPQLNPPAQSSPSFLCGKLKQALKPCPSEDKESEDCKEPPRPFQAEGAPLQVESNEVLFAGCWSWGGRRVETDTSEVNIGSQWPQLTSLGATLVRGCQFPWGGVSFSVICVS